MREKGFGQFIWDRVFLLIISSYKDMYMSVDVNNRSTTVDYIVLDRV